VNAVTLDLVRSLDAVVATGVAAVRLEFTSEAPSRVAEVVRGVRDALEAVAAGRPVADRSLAEPATAGHFFRGVR
jgi:collagenase-like PrtC family protease